MEEDYEYYLKEQAFLSAEIEYEEGELLREMYQKPAKIEIFYDKIGDKSRELEGVN